MKTKIEIKSVFGEVLFEYETENNTIKKTLEKAVSENAYLRNAYLENANLRNAYLGNAYLENANLRNANLENANLENANLRNAYLRNANLRNAYLENANLPIFCKWSFAIVNNKIKIGCKTKSIEDWDLFFNSKKEYETKRNTEDFKRIEAVYNGLKAYLETLNK